VNSNLKTARDQAVEASSLKSAFIANMSHELRTPLSGVLGMNELLLNSALSDGQRKLAQTVQDSARSLLSIVNDILDLSKIEAGKMNLENIRVNISDIVHDGIQLLSAAARSKNLELQAEIDPALPDKLFGDPVRLHQVLLNLLGNAIKFTYQGAVTVRASLLQEDDTFLTAKFEVVDTGIGISNEDRRFLFLPFTQVDRSTTRIYGGTGLGLNISKRLVELMGGQIGVDTESGKGSTFWFTVPFKKKGTEAMPRPEGTQHGVTADSEILIVEDHPALQDMVDMQLTHLGLPHRVVGTAEEALSLIQSHEFALVLMDCHLPKMDGYDATRAIRELEKDGTRHLPIVAMTAGAMKGDPEKCLAAGMDDYLAKPYTIEQLRDKLSRWIPNHSIQAT
jgi:CheY-like chemotaxis protein